MLLTRRALDERRLAIAHPVRAVVVPTDGVSTADATPLRRCGGVGTGGRGRWVLPGPVEERGGGPFVLEDPARPDAEVWLLVIPHHDHVLPGGVRELEPVAVVDDPQGDSRDCGRDREHTRPVVRGVDPAHGVSSGGRGSKDQDEDAERGGNQDATCTRLSAVPGLGPNQIVHRRATILGRSSNSGADRSPVAPLHTNANMSGSRAQWRFPRRLRLGAAVTVSAAVLMLVGPLAIPAGAHADVVSVSPGAGAVLEQSPAAVKITFTEGIDVKRGGITVYDGAGDRVPVGRLRQPEPERLILPIRAELDDGAYIVTWRGVSEDTHSLQGTWTFRVGDAPLATGAIEALAGRLLADQKADAAVAIGWGIARAAVFGALALFLGAAVFAAVIWPRTRASRRARNLVTAGWIALDGRNRRRDLVLWRVLERGHAR